MSLGSVVPSTSICLQAKEIVHVVFAVTPLHLLYPLNIYPAYVTVSPTSTSATDGMYMCMYFSTCGYRIHLHFVGFVYNISILK